MDFYGKLTADPKTQIQNVVIEQNKWLKVMQEEQPPYQDLQSEHDQSAFYEANQVWLSGEIEHYLKNITNKDEEDSYGNEEPSVAKAKTKIQRQ